MGKGGTSTRIVVVATLVLTALGAWFVLAPAQDNASARRSEVLRLARKGELRDVDKRALFSLLAGEQFQEYAFTDAERALILKAIGG